MKIDQKEQKALSGSEIMKLLNGRTKVIKYSELGKIHDINELLFGHDSCVILILSRENYGHWVCLTRRGNILEFFDSYGYLVDDPIYFKNTSKYFRKHNGQDFPLLSYLLLKCGNEYDLTYNEINFQKDNKSVATCGRHVACRIRFRKMDLYDYCRMLRNINPDYDKAVVLLTHKV